MLLTIPFGIPRISPRKYSTDLGTIFKLAGGNVAMRGIMNTHYYPVYLQESYNYRNSKP